MGQQHADLDHVIKTCSAGLKNRLAVGQGLTRLELDGVPSEAAGCGVYPDRSGDEDEGSCLDTLAVVGRARSISGRDDLTWHAASLIRATPNVKTWRVSTLSRSVRYLPVRFPHHYAAIGRTIPLSVLLVGATGTVGGSIATHLLADGIAEVHLLVRSLTPSDPDKAAALETMVRAGAVLIEGDLHDPDSLEAATLGADVVISAVQGGRDIIVDGQVALARAAKASGVRRFIPSDFALDIWAAPAGAPMFELRKEADAAIDELGLEVVHVLNGAFMDMMLDPRTAGVVDLAKGTGNFYGDGDDPFDITLIDDVAAFTARVATDESATAGTYALSGSRTSFNDIIAEVEKLTGRTLTRNSRGSVEDLRAAVAAAGNPWAAIGQWYNLSMITTPPFTATANDRYPDLAPTTLTSYLRSTLADH